MPTTDHTVWTWVTATTTMLTHACATTSVVNRIKDFSKLLLILSDWPLCVCVCVLCCALYYKHNSTEVMNHWNSQYLPCKWKNVLGLNSWLSMWSCFSHTSSSCCLLPGWCNYNCNNKNYPNVWSPFNYGRFLENYLTRDYQFLKRVHHSTTT